MNTEQWLKLNNLFAEALELLPNERAAFLALVDDVEIKNEPELLLGAHESSNKLFDKNAIEISARTLAENDSVKFIGRQIGHFKIVSEIGRGGMGTVFLAERTGVDFTQKAALKLIKRGMDTDFIIHKFQNERRILSRLNHSFIAKLLDGGTTDDGLPYFVMEYVEGKNFKGFCRTENLSQDAKLKLFRQICEAVTFAHRNLIIHRDLKPSNIIITEAGIPKLLDFGIAKMLDPDAENTEKTTTEFRLLTPKYASPEQMRNEPVNTQSDVYSLCVLLREMLEDTDTSLHAVKDMDKFLNSELKTIANKATNEELSRRYVSVKQLAEDIRRYQQNLPILAQPDRFIYRAGKFTERHRYGVLAASLILLTLLGGIGATFWQFRQAQSERNLAQSRFNDVRGLANSVIFDLHDEIQMLPGSIKARSILVEKALEYLNKLQQVADNDVGLQHELAMAYLKIADIQGQVYEASLLQTGEARNNYRKALELSEKTVQAQPDNFEFRRDLALICHRFARALRGVNDLSESLAFAKRSAELFEPIVKEKADDAELQRLSLEVRRNYADILYEMSDLQNSILSYQKILKDSESAVQNNPADIKLALLQSIIQCRMAKALLANNNIKESLDLMIQAKNSGSLILSKKPNDFNLLRNVAIFCEDLGRVASEAGNNTIAESNFQEEVTLMEKIAYSDTENTEANYDVASAHNFYAEFLEKNNCWKESFTHRQKTIEAIRPLEKKEIFLNFTRLIFSEHMQEWRELPPRLDKKN